MYSWRKTTRDDGCTPLHIAAEGGLSRDVVRYLRTAGAPGAFGARHAAAARRRGIWTIAVRDRPAPRQRLSGRSLAVRDSDGGTPLHECGVRMRRRARRGIVPHPPAARSRCKRGTIRDAFRCICASITHYSPVEVARFVTGEWHPARRARSNDGSLPPHAALENSASLE
jgi:Ankyrin repeat